MPTRRANHTSSAVDGIIYVIGGITWPNTIATVEAYDPVGNSWSTKTPMPAARAELTSEVVNGIIYVMGGVDLEEGIGTALRTVEAYDPIGNSWSTKAPMPTAREYLTSSVVDGIIYAIGGDDFTSSVVGGIIYVPGGWGDFSNASTTVEAYNPATNTWSIKSPMPTARGALTSEAVAGLVYAIGGGDGSGLLSTLEAFAP